MKGISGLSSVIFLVSAFVLSSVVYLGAQEKSAASLYNEGLSLLKSKDYVGGLALMEEALAKAGPEDEKVVSLAKKNGAIAAYNAGSKLRKAGSHEEALSFYNKGIELAPSNSSNYEGLARTYEAQGNTDDAIKAYLHASIKGIEEGKKEKAKSRAKKARTMVGKLFVNKNYEAAISAGSAFNSVKDDDAEVHYYISRSYAESNNAELALEHATTAITLTGDGAPDKYYYAQATQFEALGQTSEAIAAYKKIKGEKYKAQADYRIRELEG